MDRSEQKKMRSGSSNFSKTEKDSLVDIILGAHKQIIECKKTDKVSISTKERAWKEVAIDFNSRNLGPHRDWKSIKLCYENIKKRTKKAFAHDKVEMHKTGGGNYVVPTVTESGHKLIAALKPQFLPISNPYDDDVDFHPEVSCDVSNTKGATNEDGNIVLLVENENDDDNIVRIDLEEEQQSQENGDVELQVCTSSQKKRNETVADVRGRFYKRRLECLEKEHELKVQCLLEEHKIKIETLKIEKELKELELQQKKNTQ